MEAHSLLGGINLRSLFRNGVYLFSIFVLVLLLSACNSSEASKAGQSKQSKFPEKDIEFIVGYSPGGGYSDYAQGLAPFIDKYLPNDVNVIVRHMPGAGSVTAANYIQKAKPDGYTIGIYNVSGLAPTQVSQEVGYDLSKVTWLGRVGADNNIALVSKDSKYKSMKDFTPDKKYIVSTKGLQSQDTLAGVITLSELGLDWEPLNHEGTGEAALSVIRGDADIIWSSYESVKQYIDSGDLVPILYYSNEPHPDFPDVPIPSDLGISPEVIDGFNSQRLIGAPPNLPEDVSQILQEAIQKAIEDPEFVDQMEKMERSVSYMDAEGSADMVNSALNGFEKFQDVISQLYAE